MGEEVSGRVIAAALLALATPAGAEMVNQVDWKKPERPAPGPADAMIVMRPWASGMAGDNRIYIFRIDPVTGEPVRDAAKKPEGAQLTFSMTLFGGKKGERPLRAAIVPAGTYVLGGRRFNGTYTDAFCFGAPRFEVAPGAVTYIGDYQMLALEKMADGERRNAMRYSAELDGARTALAAEYPALAGALALWSPRNGSTYRCEGDEFTAYAVPGAPAIEGSAPAR